MKQLWYLQVRVHSELCFVYSWWKLIIWLMLNNLYYCPLSCVVLHCWSLFGDAFIGCHAWFLFSYVKHRHERSNYCWFSQRYGSTVACIFDFNSTCFTTRAQTLAILFNRTRETFKFLFNFSKIIFMNNKFFKKEQLCRAILMAIIKWHNAKKIFLYADCI
jgi:hypothetical protein